MPIRKAHPWALAPGTSAVAPGHVRRGPRLVDEDEALWTEVELVLEPVSTLPQYVGTVLLDRMTGLSGWPTPHHRRRLRRTEEEPTMIKTPIAVLGIDLGKNSCSLAGLDVSGAVVLRFQVQGH